MVDRLASSTSPYLRQHADNPVDWREWGDEAFAEARERDVPVLVSRPRLGLPRKATTSTIRAQLINIPGRLARSARQFVLHLPTDWPREIAWNQMATAARHGPPAVA